MVRLACLVLLALLLAPVVYAEEGADDREAILGLLAPRRGESIADVGCGLGTWSIALAKAVGSEGRVYAVDIDPDAVAPADAGVSRGGRRERSPSRSRAPTTRGCLADSARRHLPERRDRLGRARRARRLPRRRSARR